MHSPTLWLGHWVLNRGREPRLELNLLPRQVLVLCRDPAGKQPFLQPQLLLFLDEPTSGLDSQSAWAIMAFLRSLADNGQSILCT